MTTINFSHCPLCGATDLEKQFNGIDYFSSKESFPLFKCNNCDFTFTNNIPAEDEIEKYYDSNKYISHSDSNEGLINKLYRKLRIFTIKRKATIIKSLIKKENAKLLDIGCGTGYFINYMKKQGWEVAGIEKNEKARENAIANFSLNVTDINILNETRSSTYDIITLWHVLEHLEKLNETMIKIREIVKPSGFIVIAVPNCNSFDANFYRDKWAAYDIPRHLWHFTPDTLKKLLHKYNLDLVEIHRMPLDAFYIALLSEDYCGSNFLKKYIRALFVGIWGGFLSLFNKEYSSSLIYIVKQKKQ